MRFVLRNTFAGHLLGLYAYTLLHAPAGSGPEALPSHIFELAVVLLEETPYVHQLRPLPPSWRLIRASSLSAAPLCDRASDTSHAGWLARSSSVSQQVREGSR